MTSSEIREAETARTGGTETKRKGNYTELFIGIP